MKSSPEATLEDLRHAYRLLLGREPDPDGLAVHGRLIRERQLSPADLAQIFLTSDEFLATRHGAGMTRVSLRDYCIYINPSDREISAVITSHQTYEPHVESVLRRLLKPGDTFLDVGANIGYFTALGAFLVGRAGSVIAFEPLDKNLQLIYAMLWENRFENVTVFPFAAASERKLVAMRSPVFSSNAGIVDRSIGQQRTDIIAQSQRLDDLVPMTPRIDVIKFDIEGHEMHAWCGAANLLKKHRPHVLTEFHPKCIRENARLDPVDYLRTLLGYSGAVEVLHRERPNVVCRDVEAVLREWQFADDEFGMSGGMHIDLYVRAPER